MPELPEVTTISNQLRKEIRGFAIEGVKDLDSYRTEPEFSIFKKEVVGKKIQDVARIAKTIVVELKKETPWDKESPSKNPAEMLFLVFHLAMTGRLLLRNTEDQPDPWSRLVFHLTYKGVSLTGAKIPDLNPSDPGSDHKLRFLRKQGLPRAATSQ